MSAYYIQYDELERVLGPKAAAALVSTRGGTQFYVGERATPSSLALAREIGQEAARALTKYIVTGIGGLYIEIPRRKMRENVDLREFAADRTLSAAFIARKLNISERTVRRMRARLRNEGVARAAS